MDDPRSAYSQVEKLAIWLGALGPSVSSAEKR
jgi:hypothetical protein